MSKPMDDAQTDVPTLLPCPFCQEDSAQMYGGLGAYCVRCDTCGTDGPRGLRQADAIAKWNRRTLVPSAALASPRATGSTKPAAWALADKYGKIDANTAGPHDLCESRVEHEGRAFTNDGPFRVVPLYDHPSPSLASATAGDGEQTMREWVIERWDAEVANRPTQNIHRRTLDNTWRQVYRWLTDEELPRPKHPAASPPVPESPSPNKE